MSQTAERLWRCLLLALTSLVLAASPLAAQSWRSELFPLDWRPPNDRSFETDKLIQDFSYAGYHRGERPLPDREGPVHDVTDYGADPTGDADATVPIQEAIDQAGEAGGGVVYLPEGRYRVSVDEDEQAALRIEQSGVVLRGAGRDRTFIFNDTYRMRGKTVVRIGPPDDGDWRQDHAPPGPEIKIREDLSNPTREIPVNDVSELNVGDWIVLRADATEAFIDEHGMADLWSGKGDRLRGVAFYRQILEIDEDERLVRIDVPIRYYLKTRDNARIYYTLEHVEEVGLERLSIGNRQHPDPEGWAESDYHDSENASYHAHGMYLVLLRRVRNGWVRDVSSYRPEGNGLNVHTLSNGLGIQYSRGVTVRRATFERPQYGGGGGNGYMIRLSNANETLVRDAHVAFNRHGMVVSGMASSGNVFTSGSARRTRWQGGGDQRTNGSGSDHHMHLSQSTLFDRMTVEDEYLEARYRGHWGDAWVAHGVTATHCVFWNTRGLRYAEGREYIVHSAQARYGYIIGTQGSADSVNIEGPTRTRPIDHVEGVGKGDRLQPQSLYEAQLRRRLREMASCSNRQR